LRRALAERHAAGRRYNTPGTAKQTCRIDLNKLRVEGQELEAIMSTKSNFGSIRALALLLVIGLTRLQGATVTNEKAETDTTVHQGNSFFVLPFVFHSPETKLGGGAMVGFYFREPGSSLSSRPSSVVPKLVYTQEKQVSIGSDFDLYFKDEKYHFLGTAYYSKFPTNFYGIGNDTPEANEEEFTPEGIELEVVLQRRIAPGWHTGFRYGFVDMDIEEVEDDRMLVRRNISGSNGGTVSGLGWLLNWDTRDNVWYPSTGGFHQFSLSRYDAVLGSDFEYNRLYFDSRMYRSLGRKHVLALQGVLQVLDGDPPFTMMSMLGGDRLMRGYYQGRFREQCMLVLQLEHRAQVWRRVGLVGFAGLGQVAGETMQFGLEDFKYSLGFGLRYMIVPREKVNVRLDFAFGEGTSEFYLSFAEAF